jgi:ABC-type lipoprotein export system ATPase subunit
MFEFLLNVDGTIWHVLCSIYALILGIITIDLNSSIIKADDDMYFYIGLWLMTNTITHITSPIVSNASYIFETNLELAFKTSALEKYQKLNYFTKDKETFDTYDRKLNNVIGVIRSFNSWGINTITYTVFAIVDIWTTLDTMPIIRISVFVIMASILYYLVQDTDLETVMKKNVINADKLANRWTINRIYFELGKKPLSSLLDIIEQKHISRHKITLAHVRRSRMIEFGEFIITIMIMYTGFHNRLLTNFANIIRSLTKFSNAISNLSRFANSCMEDKVSLDTYTKFWKENECNLLSNPIKLPFPDRLTITSLDFTRPSTNYHLKSESEFYLPRGSATSLRGDTASGKSTFLDLLMGRDTVDQNSSLQFLEGKPRQFVHHVCECGQGTSSKINWRISTVREHFNDDSDDEKILYYCDIVCIGDKVRILKLDEPIENALSGGEQQRITLASNLYHAYSNDSKLLILDEPEKGLGSMAAKVIENIIRMKESRDAILIISTHDEKISPGLFSHHIVIEKDDNTSILKMNIV